MKKCFLIILLLLMLLPVGCAAAPDCDIAATTLPVYQFTAALCDGTELAVRQIVTESVSCLHDYSLSVSQMRSIENAQLVIVNGAGLEESMEDALHAARQLVDASEGIELLPGEEEYDPHIWLSTECARKMCENICQALCLQYPGYQMIFEENLNALTLRFDELAQYAQSRLQDLGTRNLITFHDGFSYFAKENNLTVLCSVEEEAGSEASASTLEEIVSLIGQYQVRAIFVEENGSDAAAKAIAAETGVKIFTLRMGFSGEDYFETMRQNIDTVREALQ